MTQKEKELLYSIFSSFEKFDRKTIEVVVRKLSSDEFSDYLDAREKFLGVSSTRNSRRKKENQIQEDESEESQLIKRVLRLIKNAKLKPTDIEQTIKELYPEDPSVINVSANIQAFLRKKTTSQIIEIESALMKLCPSKDTANSLDNWSSLIVKDKHSPTENT